MSIIERSSWEFKYISEPATTVQKLLNQWKHTYRIAIIMSEFDTKPGSIAKYINMLIAREKL